MSMFHKVSKTSRCETTECRLNPSSTTSSRLGLAGKGEGVGETTLSHLSKAFSGCFGHRLFAVS